METQDQFGKQFNEDAWRSFETHRHLPQDVSEKMFSYIEAQTVWRPSLRHLLMKYVSVAAAFLVCLSTWLFFHPGVKKSKPLAVVAERKIHKPALRFNINTTNRSIHIALPDGSAVELAPGSEIRYAQSYPAEDRNIHLKGIALFKVAASSARPFSVYAGGLQTTALGTVFRVSEKSHSAVSVELLQGKVVVCPDSLLKSRGVMETYLLPGQQLNFNPLAGIVSVQRIKRAVSSSAKTILKQVYRFDNLPLASIIKTLENSHHLKFVYADSLVNDLNFTGIFNENKESLDDFMKTICALNNLTMEKRKSTIFITPNNQ